MKKLFILVALVLFCASVAEAQVQSRTAFRFRKLPTFTVCQAGDVVFDTTSSVFKGCTATNTPGTLVMVGAGGGSSIPYDLATQVTGKPESSAVVLRFVAIRSVSLAATGHKCSAGTSATAQSDFVLAVNGSSKGTLRFAAAGTTCSIVSGATAAIVAGDVVTITSPTQDATLSDIAFSVFTILP